MKSQLAGDPSVRLRNRMLFNGVRAIEDLANYTAHEVLNWHLSGPSLVEEARLLLEMRGLSFHGDRKSIQPPPPYVTVAECGHCFEDVGERA